MLTKADIKLINALSKRKGRQEYLRVDYLLLRRVNMLCFEMNWSNFPQRIDRNV